MAKKRTGDPWMPAPKYAATLRGFGVNLFVTSIPASVSFAEIVFSARCVYSDLDFRRPSTRRHGMDAARRPYLRETSARGLRRKY